MGFRVRKAFKLAPGVRMTVSRRGVSYSAGGKGVRVTRRADGRTQTTVGLPGSGISYTTVHGQQPRRRRAAAASAGVDPRKAAMRDATQIARQQVPMTARIRWERIISFVGIGGTFVSFCAPPLLLVTIPCLLVGLGMMVTNLKDEQRWYREFRAARAQALEQLQRSGR